MDSILEPREMRYIFMVPVFATLSGCASIVEGTRQEIDVYTTPGDATCGLYKKNAKIAEIEYTPGATFVNKTKDDIMVWCVRSGYEQATAILRSDIAFAAFGNILVDVFFFPFGLIGWGIDSADGAERKYDSAVFLRMVPSTPTLSRVIPRSFLPAILPFEVTPFSWSAG